MAFYVCKETLFEYFCIGAYDEKMEECLSVNDLVADFLSVGLPMVSSKTVRVKGLAALLSGIRKFKL